MLVVKDNDGAGDAVIDWLEDLGASIASQCALEVLAIVAQPSRKLVLYCTTSSERCL
jgi:hypothetical protein